METQRVSAQAGRLGWLTAGAAVGVLAAVVLAPSFGPAMTRAATDTTPEHTITVAGTGRVLAKPDVADVSLGIHVVREKAKESENAAAEIMTRVIAALKAAGIKDEDIQTAMMSLQPQYDYSASTQRLVGYATDNIVTVTIRQIDKTGEIIDSAVDAGATNVNGITFRVSDQTAFEKQARKAAMEDARGKADAYANAGDVQIRGIQSISEVSAPMPWPMYAAKDAAGAPAEGATTPIQPGNVTLEVTVTVVFLIN